MFKKLLRALTLISMIISLLCMSVIGVSAAHPFDDIPKWANEYVETVYSAGIMQGIGDTAFGSDGSFTREQLVVTLYRLSGSNARGPLTSLSEFLPMPMISARGLITRCFSRGSTSTDRKERLGVPFVC